MTEEPVDINAILRNILDPELGRLTLTDILLSLTLALLLGMIISYIYRKTYQGVLYSHSLSTSFVFMALITSMIIMTIGLNLVLTLGMVGALSIIRFRTPIKDPMDIVFIFWAIAVGLAAGAKLYLLAFIGTLFISLAVLSLYKYKAAAPGFMLIIRYDTSADVEEKVFAELRKLKHSVKSKSLTRGKTELVVELRMTEADSAVASSISSVEGVADTVLMRYSGEHVS